MEDAKLELLADEAAQRLVKEATAGGVSPMALAAAVTEIAKRAYIAGFHTGAANATKRETERVEEEE